MLPILNTLAHMLHCLDIQTYFNHLDEEQPLIIDQTLFKNTANINRIMFTNIAYFLFSILDDRKADEYFNNIMDIEDNDQYQVFVENTVSWLTELSDNFELLRHVPIVNTVFYDCSGPLMDQIMFAFTMAVVRCRLFDGEVHTLTCRDGTTFDRSNFYAYYKIFKHMITDKNDINRKAFEADLLEYLLKRTYGQECCDRVLSKCTDDDNVSVTSSVTVVQSDTERPSTEYPLKHRGVRIKFKRPYFRQHSPLNENRVLKSAPTPSIWDLNHHAYFQNPIKHFRPHLLNSLLRQRHPLFMNKLAEEKRQEQRLADELERFKEEKARLVAEEEEAERLVKAEARLTAAQTKARLNRQIAIKNLNQETFAAAIDAECNCISLKIKLNDLKKSIAEPSVVVELSHTQASRIVVAIQSARHRLTEELRFAADMMLAEEKLAQERQRLAQVVLFDQENHRGTKRKHEEIQENAPMPFAQNRKTVLGSLF